MNTGIMILGLWKYLHLNLEWNILSMDCVRWKNQVRSFTHSMEEESAMREGCIGQLPEIYDGGNPSSSKGCFSQAWSVGKILRVYEAVEKGHI